MIPLVRPRRRNCTAILFGYLPGVCSGGGVPAAPLPELNETDAKEAWVDGEVARWRVVARANDASPNSTSVVTAVVASDEVLSWLFPIVGVVLALTCIRKIIDLISKWTEPWWNDEYQPVSQDTEAPEIIGYPIFDQAKCFQSKKSKFLILLI